MAVQVDRANLKYLSLHNKSALPRTDLGPREDRVESTGNFRVGPREDPNQYSGGIIVTIAVS